MHLALLLTLAAAPVAGPPVPLGAPIAGPSGSIASSLELATNGTSSLAVWLDDRERYATVYAARFSPTQGLIDAHDLKVDVRGASQPSVVWFPGPPAAFSIIWRRQGIRLRRLGPSGTFLDAVPKLLVPAPVTAVTSAADATSIYLVWADGQGATNTLKFARVDASGAVSSMPMTLFTGNIIGPKVSVSGGRLLVTWATSDTTLVAMRLQTNGTLLDAVPFNLTTSASSNVTGRATPTAGGWFVGISDRAPTNSLKGVFVPFTGFPPAPLPIAAATGLFCVGWDDASQRAIALWQDFGSDFLVGTRVAASTGVVDVPPIVIRNAPTTSCALAVDPTLGLQLVSNEARLGSTQRALDLYASRLTPALAGLDGLGTVISQAVNFQEAPRLATDGRSYLVTWQEYRIVTGWDIWAVLAGVDATGAVTLKTPFVLRAAAGDQIAPRVAYTNGTWLVAWENEELLRVELARVSTTGLLLDPTPLTLPEGDGTGPAVAGNAGTFLVAYASAGVKARRLAPDGGWLDATPRVVSSVSNSSVDGVAGGNDGFAVAFNNRARATSNDLYLNRVTSAGAVLDGQGAFVTTATSMPSSADIGFDGQRFLAAWHDHRLPGSGTIFGAHIGDAGVVEPQGFQIGPNDGDEQLSPRLGRLGDGTFLVWVGEQDKIKWQAIFQAAPTPALQLMPALDRKSVV